jgi:hypothetical protein
MKIRMMHRETIDQESIVAEAATIESEKEMKENIDITSALGMMINIGLVMKDTGHEMKGTGLSGAMRKVAHRMEQEPDVMTA